MNKLTCLALCCAVLSLAGTTALHAADPAAPPLSGDMKEFSLLETPRPAPDIAFTDGAGNPVRLSDFRGKVVLVNLWATWCAPCVEEMPALARLQKREGGEAFDVIALSSDRGGAKIVEPFFEKLGLAGALTTYLDPRGMATRAFSPRGLPTSILVDREGREIGRLEGSARWDGPAAAALIHHYTAPPPVQPPAGGDILKTELQTELPGPPPTP